MAQPPEAIHVPTLRSGPTGGVLSEFLHGAGDIGRAARFLSGRPSLWLWAMIPFLLNIAFFFLLGWSVWHFAGQWLQAHLMAGQGFWHEMAGWVLSVLVWAVFALVVFFLFVPLASLIAAPFNDILSEKVERLYAGIGLDAPFSVRAMLRAVAIGLHSTVRLSLLTLCLLAGSMLLHLIPGIGSVLATIASTAITIRFLSLEYTSYSMDRRFFTYDQRRSFLRRYRARTIGLGVMAFVIMLVPVLNALFIPISAVAGTLLFCDTQLGGASEIKP